VRDRICVASSHSSAPRPVNGGGTSASTKLAASGIAPMSTVRRWFAGRRAASVHNPIAKLAAPFQKFAIA